jgi:hypothetical protein
MRNRRLLVALALSFLVYLAPLVGPHAAWLLGELLVGLFRRPSVSAAWIAADLATALALQTLVFVVAWIALGRGVVARALAAMAAIVAVTWAANVLLLYLIPLQFLVTSETAAVQDGWPRVCTARNTSLVMVPLGQQRATWTRGLALVESTSRQFMLLDGNTCASAPIGPSSHLALAGFAENATLLLQPIDRGAPLARWMVRPPGGEPIQLQPPAGHHDVEGGPALSNDGQWVGWLVPVAGTGQPPLLEAHLEKLDGTASGVVPLSALPTRDLFLLGIQPARERIVVSFDARKVAVVRFDGGLERTVADVGVEPLPGTLLVRDDGYLAWDGYREDAPYRVRWSLAGGRGAHDVTRGRAITDIATDPAGRWIALSVTSQYSIGGTEDSVYVLRASDGAEVFRRFFPKYTRALVAFPGPARFAYTVNGATEVRGIR